MKLKLLGTIVLVFFLLGSINSCASSGSGSQMEKETKNQISRKQNATLEDYLRSLSGVRVSGTGYNLRVTIRGNMSITDSHEQPLFILNGTEMGTDYGQVARSIAPGTIISVEAVPPSRASIYGMRGIAGAILIKTE